ncbi:hypothetical protein K505DRAFT_69911 [Melanomma pulvis-pyrius CBS 109.77]|uniref:Uncharacterized protein n=1 Tax=Melanomma pulvis-pyrius CBS 109.77 TaxID=1314802 RepID=A0A6A6XYW5_9PLEO|nr:hypothetical protein K505DRAFT_69911 [Melanomma pulvis-pyrius CBS 109.77]
MREIKLTSIDIISLGTRSDPLSRPPQRARPNCTLYLTHLISSVPGLCSNPLSCQTLPHTLWTSCFPLITLTCPHLHSLNTSHSFIHSKSLHSCLCSVRAREIFKLPSHTIVPPSNCKKRIRVSSP